MKKIEIKCKVTDSLPLDNLIHFQGGIKSLSEENHQRLRTRIREKGFRYPFHIWVDSSGNHNILDGHQRLAVLQKLKEEGYEIPELPVHQVYCDTLEEAKEEVLAISSQYGQWEQEELQIYLNDYHIELDNLSLSSPELDLSGIYRDDITIGDPVETKGDDEPSPIVEKESYLSELGTVWTLNGHTLICGSSTDPERLRTYTSPYKTSQILVFTDPPYGINVVKKEVGKIGNTSNNFFLRIEGDSDTNTAREFWEACREVRLENFILWGGNYFTDFVPPSQSWLVWYKGISENMDFSQCELAWTSFTAGGVDLYDVYWNGWGRAGDKKDELESRIHPNQKPVLLMEECLRRRGEDFDVILDGFCGSGSFLIGAEKTNKKYIGFELMPAYCDASVKRWVDWMRANGRDFTLLKDGEEFLDFDSL